MKKTLILALAMLVITVLQNQGQEVYKPSKTQFMIRGYGSFSLNVKQVEENEEEETEISYEGPTFSPIFIFRHSDKLLFEGELEFEFEEGQLEMGVEYANISYVLHKYFTVRAGKFLLPFGTFMEKFHPSWINRFPNMPLGFGHEGIMPATDYGIELRGAAPIGGGKINYAAYVTNGPTLNTGEDEPEEAGLLHFDNIEDNNNNKAVGCRIGVLPFTNSSVEVGLSSYFGKVGASESEYEDVKAFLYAADFSFVKQISGLKGIVDLKGQFSQSMVDDATYYKTEEGDTVKMPYTFDNKGSAYYVQLSYRPSMVSKKFIKNLELAGRYSALKTPEGSMWEQNTSQYAIGLNYWINWRTVLKFSYIKNNAGDEHEGEEHGEHEEEAFNSGFFIQWALGF